MTKNILITVCLANDMVAPIKKYESPPHKLHIGYYETVRLLGEEISKGPLINFLKSCYKTSSKKLDIIHIRDWHNADDPEQKRELEIYGSHCMAGTWGAKFVWEDKNLLTIGKNVPNIINSKKIMTTLETDFISKLNTLVGKTPKNKVKIGIIGVLTNIKVQQIAIALQQWLGFENIAVCSALTASNNIRKHFQGLEDLKNIYGINVFDSINIFSNWLKVDYQHNIQLESFDNQKIELTNKETILDNTDKDILGYLFRECKIVKIGSLKGGYSSSKVFLVEGIDKQGSTEVPNILKVDTKERIGQERTGFEKIEHILGSHVPKIVNSIESGTKGAIRYSFAMMNKNDKPKTFRDFYLSLNGMNNTDLENLNNFFNILFEEIFTPLYSNYVFDQKQLWASNTFLNDCEKISSSISKSLGPISKNKNISLKGIGEFYNPINFYKKDNILNKMNKGIFYVRQSLAHGDLNPQNILLDSRHNMWLIDFYSTNYDYHIIQDIAMLESNLKLLLTKINNEQDLIEIIKLEKILMSQKSLSEEISDLPKELLNNPSLIKLYHSIKRLRKFAYQISQDKEMINYFIPLLNYTGYVTTYSNLPKYQNLFAIISTSLLCDYLK